MTSLRDTGPPLEPLSRAPHPYAPQEPVRRHPDQLAEDAAEVERAHAGLARRRLKGVLLGVAGAQPLAGLVDASCVPGELPPPEQPRPIAAAVPALAALIAHGE